MIRRGIYALLSVLLSAGLMLSIPFISIIVKGDSAVKKEHPIRTAEVRRVALTPDKKDREKLDRRPRKRLSPQMSAKAGPRFAMSLDALGMDGAAVDLEMVTAKNSSAGEDDDGVDKRPELAGAFEVNIPDALKKNEVNASVRLQFCVDIAGRPYDIRIAGETPAGSGLGLAGKEALMRTTFSPALRGGRAVPFCGMEQPVEVRFRN